jgi:hypothetical protein
MPPETVSAGSRDSGLNAGAPRVSDTLVKAIRVGVQNSPKVSMRADPGQFYQASNLVLRRVAEALVSAKCCLVNAQYQALH